MTKKSPKVMYKRKLFHCCTLVNIKNYFYSALFEIDSVKFCLGAVLVYKTTAQIEICYICIYIIDIFPTNGETYRNTLGCLAFPTKGIRQFEKLILYNFGCCSNKDMNPRLPD